jgi:hypothetical protein
MKFAKGIGLLAVCAALGFGQANTEAKATAAKGQKEASVKGGIKVHGHWVLEVKNPDGSVAERKEFENSLVTVGEPTGNSSGSYGLSQILAGQAYVYQWSVGLTNSITVCCNTILLQQGGCAGVQTNGALCAPLTVILNPTSTGLVFQGSSPPVTAATTTSMVASYFYACGQSVAQNQCANNGFPVIFTAANQSLTLQVGQAVLVTVNITFS